MLVPAQERLKELSVQELVEKGKIEFDQESSDFLVKTMGRTVRVHFPDFTIEEKLDMWHCLTLLQYMYTATGIELSGEMQGLTQMRGGLARGAGFDKDISVMFARYFSKVSAADFRSACEKLGGTIVDGKADVTAVISYAPMFPVMLNFWEADDEFPASGKVLVDKNAECYLELEAAGGACAAVVQAIAGILGTYEINSNWPSGYSSGQN